ncbi:uncharacterized protein VTP21DRAFT_6685 [Calcarisporiella thermophila]|uniref:uncharacterized protein n=1 Tax=Calcarisporiella thermophila TaxID=911321 RepID=UPI0037441A60
MLKQLSFATLVAHLALSALAQIQLPPGSGTPPPVREWVQAIDMTKIPAAPIQPPIDQNRQCEKAKGFCNWSCDNCINKQTDFDSCPKGTWAVTFDDGPTQFTPPLLDFLAKQKIKATFFVMGQNVRDHGPFLKRAFQEGHEIASHTWSHSALTSLTNEQIVAEMKWTEIAIEQVIGVKPKYMRPPYGDIDDRVRGILTSMGYKAVIWNHDSNDWRIKEGQSTPAAVDGNFTQWIKEAATAQVGGLSLEHDHAEITVQLAIKNLPLLAKAYKLIPLSQCVGDANVYQAGPVVNNTSSVVPLPSSATAPSMPSMVAAPAVNSSAPAVVSMAVPVSQLLPPDAKNLNPSGSQTGNAAQSTPAKSSASKTMNLGAAMGAILLALTML